MKLNSKGAIDALFIVLVVALLLVGGIVAWRVSSADEAVNNVAANTEAGSTIPTSSNEDTTGLNESDTSSIPEGWLEYANEDTGIAFAYPPEWGEITYRRTALNVEENEVNLPHTFTFANALSPVIRVFPDNWSFDPPKDTSWNYQRTYTLLQKNISSDFAMSLISNDEIELQYYYTSFDGTINVDGAKLIDLSRINASSVQYTYATPEFDEDCIKDFESTEVNKDLASLECFSENIVDDITQSIESFSGI